MTEPRRVRVLDGAVAERSTITLVGGEFRAPFSFGSEGDLRVAGRANCGRAYFDGATLFVASADAADPIFVDDAALAATWTPLRFPCRLRCGTTLIAYEADAVVPASKQRWEVETTIGTLPLELVLPGLARAAQRERERPATEARWERSPSPRAPLPTPRTALTVQPARSASTPPEPAVTERSALTRAVLRARDRLREELRRTSPAMRAALMALPVVAWVTLGSPWKAAATSTGEARVSAARPSARAAPKLASSVVAARPASAVASPAPSAAASASSVVAARAPAAVASSVAAPARRSGRSSRQRTLEARAADAAARGAFSEAALIYAQLASLHPERPEFASAVRILSPDPSRLR